MKKQETSTSVWAAVIPSEFSFALRYYTNDMSNNQSVKWNHKGIMDKTEESFHVETSLINLN